MTFDEYLKQELAKPINNDNYNPDGNSNRAVVVRGFWKEVAWQYKAHPKRLLSELKDFDGLHTELGWFIKLPIIILLSPISPIIAANHWHKHSISEYRMRYLRSLNSEH